MQKILGNKKVFVSMIILMTIFVSYGAPLLEAGSCEKAFRLCMDTYFTMIHGSDFIYCGIGYMFCIQYIET